MNYYPFHIGDFRSGTVNMTRQARWIYRDMLDIYYDAEAPMTLDIDMLCDQLGVVEDAERTIVERLLRFKFIKGEDGYRHKRCDIEIAKWNARGWHPHDPDSPSLRPSIDDWKIIRERIFLRDDYTCTYCSCRGGELECDHIHPVSRGGNSDDANLTTACKPCNRDKGSKTVEEWKGVAPT